jgi:hypothetical protein
MAQGLLIQHRLSFTATPQIGYGAGYRFGQKVPGGLGAASRTHSRCLPPAPGYAHGAALYTRAPWGREKTLIALGSVVSVAAVISATGNRKTDHFALHE